MAIIVGGRPDYHDTEEAEIGLVAFGTKMSFKNILHFLSQILEGGISKLSNIYISPEATLQPTLGWPWVSLTTVLPLPS